MHRLPHTILYMWFHSIYSQFIPKRISSSTIYFYSIQNLLLPSVFTHQKPENTNIPKRNDIKPRKQQFDDIDRLLYLRDKTYNLTITKKKK